MFVIRVAYPGGHSVWLTRRFPTATWGRSRAAGRAKERLCARAASSPASAQMQSQNSPAKNRRTVGWVEHRDTHRRDRQRWVSLRSTHPTGLQG